jgi:hypothetical protein
LPFERRAIGPIDEAPRFMADAFGAELSMAAAVHQPKSTPPAPAADETDHRMRQPCHAMAQAASKARTQLGRNRAGAVVAVTMFVSHVSSSNQCAGRSWQLVVLLVEPSGKYGL